MNKLTWALMGISLAGITTGAILKLQSRPALTTQAAVSHSETPAEDTPSPSTSLMARVNSPGSGEESHSLSETAGEPASGSTVAPPPQIKVPTPPTARQSVTAAFSQPVQTLLSRQASYAQKQAAWKQLRDDGKLGEAITELERGAKEEPTVAEYPAVLGQAYLQKLRTTPDVREQNILAMQADQSFDTALNLDPTNWDARFWKASALSFWPAEFKKSQEVMEQLSTLIDQQEAQPPQPQFAQSYVLLGEQYEKAGYPENAKQMWQRGASLFPNNEQLRAKLASTN
jgi:hypothetical protein